MYCFAYANISLIRTAWRSGGDKGVRIMEVLLYSDYTDQFLENKTKLAYSGWPIQVGLFRLAYSGWPIQVGLIT